VCGEWIAPGAVVVLVRFAEALDDLRGSGHDVLDLEGVTVAGKDCNFPLRASEVEILAVYLCERAESFKNLRPVGPRDNERSAARVYREGGVLNDGGRRSGGASGAKKYEQAEGSHHREGYVRLRRQKKGGFMWMREFRKPQYPVDDLFLNRW